MCFFVFLCVFSYRPFEMNLVFGLKMGVGLTFFGKKADLCTKNARVMNKKAEKMKKKTICVSKSCVFL